MPLVRCDGAIGALPSSGRAPATPGGRSIDPYEEIPPMPKLTLDLDALDVQSFPADVAPPSITADATANTCYRSCLVTACFC